MKTINSDINIKKTIIGVSHHRLEVFRKYQNSPKILNRSPILLINPIRVIYH